VQDTNHFGTKSHQERNQAVQGNPAMKKEYDFSKGERGKFFRPDAELSIPIYLEPQIAEAVQEHARKRSTNIGSLVNEWLRKDLRSARQTRKLKTR
jgi:hypothetical protein